MKTINFSGETLMKKNIKKQAIIYLVILGLFILTFYPFVLLIFGSFKNKMQLVENPWTMELPLHFENYTIAFEQIVRPMINSVVIVAIGMVMVVVLSSLASYALAKHRFPGSGIIYTLIIALMMIPGFTTLVPQLILIKNMGLYNTLWGLIFPMVANNVAVGVMLMTAFFKDIPSSLIEASKIEGCTEFQIFCKIVLPLSKPIIATVSIMCGLRIWNNYIWPLVCAADDTVRPVIVSIVSIMTDPSRGSGPMYAAYVIASLPLVILFFFSSKAFISGLTAGAVKG